MEQTPDTIKIAESIWQQLINAPSHLLLLLVLLLIGIMVKKSPTPNWLIPWILVTLGAVAYPFLASPTHINPEFPNPKFVLRIYGGLLGVGAIVSHIFLKKLEWFQTIENGIVNAFREDEDRIKPPSEVDPTKETV